MLYASITSKNGVLSIKIEVEELVHAADEYGCFSLT